MARKVLITGGTGSIGQALVRNFAEAQYEVTFQYGKNETIARALADEVQATAIQFDLMEPLSLDSPAYDILINSAGVLLTKTLAHEVEDQEILTTLTVNLIAPFRLIRACIPHMIDQHWGRVINIGSIYSFKGTSRNSTYNASKHGLNGLTKSVALDYADKGITCNEICPSATESEIMNGVAARRVANGQSASAEAFLDEVRQSNPMRRMAAPGDVGAVALFLASDAASFLTGLSVPVDGGETV